MRLYHHGSTLLLPLIILDGIESSISLFFHLSTFQLIILDGIERILATAFSFKRWACDNPWWNWKFYISNRNFNTIMSVIILDGIESSSYRCDYHITPNYRIILDGIERLPSLSFQISLSAPDNPWWNWKYIIDWSRKYGRKKG